MCCAGPAQRIADSCLSISGVHIGVHVMCFHRLFRIFWSHASIEDAGRSSIRGNLPDLSKLSNNTMILKEVAQ